MSFSKLRRRMGSFLERDGSKSNSALPIVARTSQNRTDTELSETNTTSSISSARRQLSTDETPGSSSNVVVNDFVSGLKEQRRRSEDQSASTASLQDALPPYEYEPISENEIRLVTILPAVNPEDPIECLLTRYERSENAGYAAISYTWGDRALVAAISCNGRRLKVTRNCESVLRTIRLPSSARTVWIDVLSIDQSNLLERNAQVAQMGDVFRRARETFACLGESERYWDIFDADITDDMWNAFLNHPWFQRTWVIQEVLFSAHITVVIGPSKIPWLDLVSLCSARNVKLPSLMSIRNDLVHEYGMRPSKSWDLHAESPDVPEDVDHEDDVLRALDPAKCGSSSSVPSPPQRTTAISLPADESRVSFFPSPSSQRIQKAQDGFEAAQEQGSDLYKAPTELSGDEERISSFKDRGTLSLNYWMLLKVMEATRAFKCHDPRDKLFAMLPLFKGQPPELLRVDYRKSVAQVYKHLSYFFLEQDQPECLVNTVGITAFDKPSWVTDWSEPPPRNKLQGVFDSSYRAGFQGTGRQIKVSRPEVENGIKLRGLIVCPIKQCSYQDAYSVFWEMPGSFSSADLLLTALGSDPAESGYPASFSGQLEQGPTELNDSSSFDKTKDHLISEIVRAAQEIDSTSKNAPSSELGRGRDFLIHMTSFGHAIFALDIAKDMLQEQAIGFARGGGPSQDDWDRHSSLVFQGERDHIMQGRCYVHPQLAEVGKVAELCGTGLVPRTVEVGDYLCILLGFKVPFVMRRFGEYWKLVGESYFFRGVMFGRLVDDLEWDAVWSDNPDSRLEDFIIV